MLIALSFAMPFLNGFREDGVMLTTDSFVDYTREFGKLQTLINERKEVNEQNDRAIDAVFKCQMEEQFHKDRVTGTEYVRAKRELGKAERKVKAEQAEVEWALAEYCTEPNFNANTDVRIWRKKARLANAEVAAKKATASFNKANAMWNHPVNQMKLEESTANLQAAYRECTRLGNLGWDLGHLVRTQWDVVNSLHDVYFAEDRD